MKVPDRTAQLEHSVIVCGGVRRPLLFACSMVLPSQMGRTSTRKRRSLRWQLLRRWLWPAAAIAFAMTLFLFARQASPPSAPDTEAPQMPSLSSLTQDDPQRQVDRVVAQPKPDRRVTGSAGEKPPRSGWVTFSEASERATDSRVEVRKTPAPPKRAEWPLATKPVVTRDLGLISVIDKTAKPPQSKATTTARSAAITVPEAPSPLANKTPRPATSDVGKLVTSARTKMDQGNAVEARRLISQVLEGHHAGLSRAQVTLIQSTLNQTMDQLLLSRAVDPSDSLVERYRVRRGESLGAIGIRYKVPYSLIMSINGLKRDRDLLADSRIKIPRGPFHAVIGKADYRMDVYGMDLSGSRVYVCSYRVGLGADNSTPTGGWIIGRGKIQDPDWRNPQTGRYYPRDDKDNPIGEHWIPLRGHDVRTRSLVGYGIHGTIEPQSIGKQSSMGCVRLLPADVKQVYQILTAGHSTVEIRP